jgi:hypothetical protein
MIVMGAVVNGVHVVIMMSPQHTLEPLRGLPPPVPVRLGVLPKTVLYPAFRLAWSTQFARRCRHHSKVTWSECILRYGELGRRPGPVQVAYECWTRNLYRMLYASLVHWRHWSLAVPGSAESTSSAPSAVTVAMCPAYTVQVSPQVKLAQSRCRAPAASLRRHACSRVWALWCRLHGKPTASTVGYSRASSLLCLWKAS